MRRTQRGRFGPPARAAATIALLAITALLAGGCATSVVDNHRLKAFNPDAGYRMKNLKPEQNNSDSLLVILTFSGGGTRAASLAYGTLEVLRDTRVKWDGEERSLLDEVDAISSVSGGSLTAAYYTLFGDRIFDDFPEAVLYRNIQGGLIRTIFSPKRAIMMMSPLYTRTDILAERFDHGIFEESTFGDLVEEGTRPYLVINATDMAEGTRFEFTQDYFDHIYSDLSRYHIGHAVAASAAFPGAFPPMTLRNYRNRQDYELPDWAERLLENEAYQNIDYRQAQTIKRYSERGPSFLHLTDGGVADNLGLLPVIQVLNRLNARSVELPGPLFEGVEKVLVITVNAEVKPPKPWDMTQSPLGMISTLLMAGITPLVNFTSAEIAYMRLLIENQELQRELREAGLMDSDTPLPKVHFVEVSFDYVSDPAERQTLNELPTSFKLERHQVDRLRAAADEVLRANPSFQEFLTELSGEAQAP